MEVGLPPSLGRPLESKPFPDQVSRCWLPIEEQARSDRFRDHVTKVRIRPCRGADHADYRVTGMVRQTATAVPAILQRACGSAATGMAAGRIACLIEEQGERVKPRPASASGFPGREPDAPRRD